MLCITAMARITLLSWWSCHILLPCMIYWALLKHGTLISRCCRLLCLASPCIVVLRWKELIGQAKGWLCVFAIICARITRLSKGALLSRFYGCAGWAQCLGSVALLCWVCVTCLPKHAIVMWLMFVLSSPLSTLS